MRSTRTCCCCQVSCCRCRRRYRTLVHLTWTAVRASRLKKLIRKLHKIPFNWPGMGTDGSWRYIPDYKPRRTHFHYPYIQPRNQYKPNWPIQNRLYSRDLHLESHINSVEHWDVSFFVWVCKDSILDSWTKSKDDKCQYLIVGKHKFIVLFSAITINSVLL